MPKIKITETDATGVIQQSGISNIVYVPIRTDVNSRKDNPWDAGSRYTDIVLCNSVDILEENFGNGEEYTKQLDYKICKHLINLGFELIVQGWVVEANGTSTEITYTIDGSTVIRSCTLGYQREMQKSGTDWPETPSDTNFPTGWNQIINKSISYADAQGAPVSISFDARGMGNFSFTEAVSGVEGQPPEPTPITVNETYTFEKLESKGFPVNGQSTSYDFKTDPSFDVAAGTKYFVYADGTPDPDATTALVYCIVSNVSYTGDIVQTNSSLEVKDGPDTAGWKTLEDKGLYDIRFLTHGTFTAQSDMVACAAHRGDCIALINIDERSPFTYNVQQIRIDFSKFVMAGSEFAAGFTPWFWTINDDLCEKTIKYLHKDRPDPDDDPTDAIRPIITTAPTLIPAAYGYLFAYANALKTSPEWYAVAGFQRGIIPEMLEPAYIYNGAEVEILQARAADTAVDLDDDLDNVGFAINAIAYVRPAGYILWGNRTLRYNDSAKKTIATSFLNVRNGVSAIKKVLYEAARRYTFEQNNSILWTNFQAYTTPLLDTMQSGNGILGYRWIKLPTTAKARLKAQLKIVPIEAVEDFELEVYLTDNLSISE